MFFTFIKKMPETMKNIDLNFSYYIISRICYSKYDLMNLPLILFTKVCLKDNSILCTRNVAKIGFFCFYNDRL